jgi:hypothetical protein
MFDSVRLSKAGSPHWVQAVATAVCLLTLASGLALLAACTAHRPKAYSVLRDNTDTDTAQRAQFTLAHLYPPKYRATQRAIITVGKQQYVCDGVLTASPESGHHLAVISTLGLVTELQVATNRTSALLRTTPLFRADWSRNFVARDVRRLFAPRTDVNRPGRLEDGRFVLESPSNAEEFVTRYVFSKDGQRVQEVEVEQHGTRVYHAIVRRYRMFPGFDREIPSEVAVVAPSYRLSLRTAELTVPTPDDVSTAAQ